MIPCSSRCSTLNLRESGTRCSLRPARPDLSFVRSRPKLCLSLETRGTRNQTTPFVSARLGSRDAALRRDRREREHARMSCSGLDVAPTKRLPYVVKTIRIFQRQVRRPSSRLLQNLYVNFCNIVSFVNELRPCSLVHLRLRLNPGGIVPDVICLSLSPSPCVSNSTSDK